jgi:hypothetical protein
MVNNRHAVTDKPRQEQVPGKKLYQQIVEDELGISQEFFKENAGPIRSRLRRASKVLTALSPGPVQGARHSRPGPRGITLALGDIQDVGDQGIIDNVINICVHVASSVVLLESTTQTLRRALRFVEEAVQTEADPSTVLTACTLYYLIHDAPQPEPVPKELEAVHRCFDNMEWLIGTRAMGQLGIQGLPSVEG